MAVSLDTGQNWLWYVNTGTDASPTWTLITTQRDSSFEITSDSVDGSYKGSGGWTTTIPTMKKWSGSFTMIYDATDLACTTIRDSAIAQTKRGYKLIAQNGENWIVAAWVTTSMSMPNQDLVTVEVSLLGDGAATYAAS
jgi:hypothetical protein